MYAADRGHVGIVKALLDEKGIDVNTPNSKKDTALLLAADRLASDDDKLAAAAADDKLNFYEGYEKIIEALLTNPNINIDAKNIKGETVFSMAKSRNNTNIITLLEGIVQSEKAEKAEEAEKAAAELIAELLREEEEEKEASNKKTKNQRTKERKREKEKKEKAAATTIQSVCRGYLANNELKALKAARESKEKAATTIQSAYRTHKARTKFDELKKAATTLQAHQRGNAARKNTNISFKQAMSLQAKITELTAQLEKASNKPEHKDASTQTDQPNNGDMIPSNYETEPLQRQITELATSFENNDRLMNTLRALNERQKIPDLFVSPDDKQWLSHFLSQYEDAQSDFTKSALEMIFQKYNLSELGVKNS